jgi:hypothetical protein
MQVTVTFTGDVIVYLIDKVWNFVFVTDHDHIALLKYNNLQLYPNGLRDPAKKIRKLALNSKHIISSPASKGPNFGNILNFSESYLHGVDPNNNSNVSVLQASGQFREIVHLTVSAGEVDGDNLLSDYWIEDLTTGKVSNVGKPTAQAVKLNFMLDEGDSPILTLDEDGVSSPLQSWEYKAAGLQLYFDNECKGVGNRADFLHFYDWLYDKNDRKFLAGKPGTSGIPSADSMQGNCDPAMIEPPPNQ